MSDVEILRTGFVAFLDGLWWGLRDSTGALSMYEGYSGGFKQMGLELAETAGGKGKNDAASVVGSIFNAIGLDVEVEKNTIRVKSCPVLNRILERGLEYAFHVETICWGPLLVGVGEKLGATPQVESSLRLIHLAKAKADHKKKKAQTMLESGTITQDEYDRQMKDQDRELEQTPEFGIYRFE